MCCGPAAETTGRHLQAESAQVMSCTMVSLFPPRSFLYIRKLEKTFVRIPPQGKKLLPVWSLLQSLLLPPTLVGSALRARPPASD